jgi:adenine-specific DNA-methyltransferase
VELEGLGKGELIDLVKKLRSKRKYGLVWEDEKTREHLNSTQELPIFKERPEFTINSDSDDMNLLIEGDNYYALSLLRYTHLNKINLIYIDPPYNTGNKDFKYNDVFVEKDDTYRHSKWLSFMQKRLKLAKDLLTEDGAIFVSIDDNEYVRLVMLMEDIFGEKNIKTIVVKMSEATGVKMASANSSGTIPKLKEYLVIAKKGGIKNLEVEKIPKEKWDNEYKQFFHNASAEELDQVKAIKDDEDRSEEDLKKLEAIVAKWENEPLSATFSRLGISNNKEQEEFKYENAWRIYRTASLEGGAKSLAIEKKRSFKKPPNYYSITTARKKCYLIDGSVNPDTPSPRSKILFADEYLTVHPGDLWTDIKTTGLENEGGVDFRNGKKPLRLIERIVKMIPNKNSIVLDFFAGSGTLGEAVMRVNQQDNGNRKYILVTNNEENICQDITLKRIKTAIDGYEVQSGDQIAGTKGALRYFEIDFIEKTSNTDEMKFRLTDRIRDLIRIKEDCFTELKNTPEYAIYGSMKKAIAIYYSYDYSKLGKLREEINQLSQEVSQLYVFTFDDEGIKPEDFEDWHGISIEPIPQKALETLENAYV